MQKHGKNLHKICANIERTDGADPDFQCCISNGFSSNLDAKDFIILYKKIRKKLLEMPIHKCQSLGYYFIASEIDNTLAEHDKCQKYLSGTFPDKIKITIKIRKERRGIYAAGIC